MSRRFIIVRLIGGLGNQLFQLQYGLNLRNQIGGQLKVDDSFLTKSAKAHETLAVAELIDSLPRVRLGWFDLKVKRVIERAYHKFGIKVPSWIRPEYLFENSLADTCTMPMVIIDGFWQRADYLNEGFVQTLRKHLQAHNDHRVGNDCVCVHVRRGDYLTNRHWFVKQQMVAPLFYYEAAFAHFRRELGVPRFEVYTDDEPWATETFSQMPDVSVVPSASLKPFELLGRMASYRNYVIANSTLSWWAAVASCHEDKQVALPEMWGKGVKSDQYRRTNWLVF
jgi:hypothetical protein